MFDTSDRSDVYEQAYFRGVTAAASLKDPHARGRLADRSAYFRGVTAAASLKLLRRQRSDAAGLEFPRRNCRGLIEASIWAGLAHGCRRRFPRRNCRGLIEASREEYDTEMAKLHFRGVTAAASLKPGVSDRDPALGVLFPRRNCRGLIEAGKQSKQSACLRNISAA